MCPRSTKNSLSSANGICDGQRKRGLALRCRATSRQRRRAQMANLANFCTSEKLVKSFRIWWTRGDSNPRPPRCERGALPAELLAHRFSLANDYTSMSYGQQVGTNWDNQIANFSAVALRFSGEKCV